MTRAEVEEAFGPVTAKLTDQGVWPDPEALAIRLANVRAKGRAKANAGDRYTAKGQAEGELCSRCGKPPQESICECDVCMMSSSGHV